MTDVIVVIRYCSGVRRHHQTWSQAAVCVCRGHCPENNHHHQKGVCVIKMILKVLRRKNNVGLYVQV